MTLFWAVSVFVYFKSNLSLQYQVSHLVSDVWQEESAYFHSKTLRAHKILTKIDLYQPETYDASPSPTYINLHTYSNYSYNTEISFKIINIQFVDIFNIHDD